MRRLRWAEVGVLLGATVPIPARPPESAPILVNAHCSGAYADSLGDLLAANAAYEKGPDSNYSYCLRTTATYEHPYYSRGGKLKKAYLRAQSHGTGFAYKAKDGDYYVATNEHVAEYPDVTDDDHAVDGVPKGSRKVREVVKIVANESDDYEPGQIPLTKVLADAKLDLAILKTKHPLRMMPYRIGRSTALRAGNVLMARGFPLGVFPASNTGKVINPLTEDHTPPWDHVDFVADALLNSGNSGSPVFAVSCRTGELELVGLYHAKYTNGTGLGLVVGIDGVREVLETLKPSRPDVAVQQAALADDRKRGMLALENAGGTLFIPYADRTVRVEKQADGVVRFVLFRDFPILDSVQMAIHDQDGRVLLELPGKLQRPTAVADLDSQLRDPLDRMLEGLWHTLRTVAEFRQADARSGTPDPAHRISELRSTLSSRQSEQRELLSTVDFEAESLEWPASAGPTADAGP
jgi:S1-C subfamily serine protease